MPSSLNLQVILALVDKLTGPAKDAAKSLDALGKEARGAASQIDKPVWTEHARTLGRSAEAATNFGAAMGGVARAAEDVEQAIRRPSWSDHERTVVRTAQAARSWADAVGGALGGVTRAAEAADRAMLMPGWVESRRATERTAQAARSWADAVGGSWAAATPPVKEHTETVEKATRKVDEHKAAVAGAGAAWEQMAQGVVAVAGAVGGATLIKKTLGAGAKAAHVDTAMQTAGATPEEVAAMHASSLDLTHQFPTQSRQTIEEMMARGRSIVGSTEHLIARMPTLLKLKSLWDREAPGAAEDGFEQHILRSMELANAITDDARAEGMAQRIGAVIAVAKGSIRPQDYSEYYQHLGSAYAQALDPEFQKGPMMTGLNEMHGEPFATGQQAFYRELLIGRVGGRFLDRMAAAGLVGDETKIHHKGRATVADPGWIVDPQTLVSNPSKWIRAHLVPAMKGMNPVEQAEFLGSLLPDPTAQRFAGLFAGQTIRTDRDTGLIDDHIRKFGSDAYKVWQQKDPGAAQAGLFAQTENLLRSGGLPVMPGATGAMNIAAQVVNLETRATEKAPEINTGLLAGAAGGIAWGAAALMENPALIRMGLKSIGAPLAAFGAAWEFGQGAGKLLVSALPEEQTAHEPPRAFGFNLANLLEPRQRDPTDRWHGLPDEVLERSRRAQNERASTGLVDYAAADAARAPSEPIAPKVDTAALDAAQAKAAETGAAMKTAIEQPLACKVDSGSLDAVLAKLREIGGLIGSINGGVGRMNAPNFTPRAAPLHDGPEAR